ncbi:hypothetical protein OIU84_000682 [Salix udensis]|uniref:Uncharacterized protein n=1 Tax=Salix udensis TaxID=889485 RepID=A0AAD6L598_9ROSI|nr:hypothetical protein OIU84_000682 [Salix udensis]
MAMPKQKFTLRFITFLLVNLWCKQMVIMAMEIIPVGVVLDLNSTVGEIAESCISMAVSDFYAVNADFKTRLALFTRDSGRDVVAATSSGICVNSHHFRKLDRRFSFCEVHGSCKFCSMFK